MTTYLAQAVGRRKTSVARVFVKKGKGEFSINDRSLPEYFPDLLTQTIVRQPLEVLDVLNKYFIKVNVQGGGIHGQAEAIRHGLARALESLDDTNRPVLKANGFLRRDPRMVERKKYGKRKARRSTQFSKR